MCKEGKFRVPFSKQCKCLFLEHRRYRKVFFSVFISSNIYKNSDGEI